MSDYDFLEFHFQGGIRRYKASDLKQSWPPPEFMDVQGFQFKRVSYSKITDEQIAGMDHVARGAMYVPVGSVEKCACTGCEKDAVRMWGGRWHCYDCLPPMMKGKVISTAEKDDG